MEVFYCPFCKRKTIPLKAFKENRYMCSMCGALERHRFLYYIYEKEFLNTQNPTSILHFAPEKPVYNKIRQNKNIEYTCCDLFPENFPYVDKIDKQDGMHLTYADASFDYVLHCHILEHVPNDKGFLKECLRVLKPNGKMIVCFPCFRDKENLEIPTTSSEERLKLYGQEDHVRRYGKNYMEKLSDESYNIQILKAEDYLTEEQIENLKIKNESNVFCIITKKH